MFLEVRHVDKSFGKEQVLQACSLTLEEHQTMSILGRSGSGKTTLLKIIAGLETKDDGELILAGKDLALVPANQRNIVYLYQEPLLFPHLNVFENIAFGLRLRKEAEAVVQERVKEMLQALEMEEHTDKAPHQLSGGQRQRVAFGRALIINPKVLLLDEPFGALDTVTRTTMQALFQRVAQTYAITALFVTHDLKEALLMGDRIALMDQGRMQHFESKQSFIEDASTGVADEIAFWRNLQSGHPQESRTKKQKNEN